MDTKDLNIEKGNKNNELEKKDDEILDIKSNKLKEINKSRYDRDNSGFLKIFLGYAPGVGKTYSMLNEGNRRFQRGEDIVIGYIEDHGRLETKEQIKDLPVIPRKKEIYKGIELEEMDLEAIIERHPQFVIVDELAHTNIPGSKNKKRYEDVLELLEHGISVLTTVNIQHIESLNDIVEKITDVVVRETIPDKIIQRANDLMIIDLPPESLINRLKEGRVYKSENISRSLDNFFKIMATLKAKSSNEIFRKSMRMSTCKLNNTDFLYPFFSYLPQNDLLKKMILQAANC